MLWGELADLWNSELTYADPRPASLSSVGDAQLSALSVTGALREDLGLKLGG